MLWLSEVLIQEHDLDSFEALRQAVGARARAGEIHFRMDVRPPFSDTHSPPVVEPSARRSPVESMSSA